MLNFLWRNVTNVKKSIIRLVKDICKYNNFTHEKTEEIQYIMRVLMYEIL